MLSFLPLTGTTGAHAAGAAAHAPPTWMVAAFGVLLLAGGLDLPDVGEEDTPASTHVAARYVERGGGSDPATHPDSRDERM